MFSVVLILVDGLGIGIDDEAINPCARGNLRIFNNFLNRPRPEMIPCKGAVIPTDANLGVPGLPQSATGQTTLLTGVNAAQVMGRHLYGFPNRTLREILLSQSLLRKAKEMGKRVRFINAYRPGFFELNRQRRLRLSATTVATLAADLPFYRLEDVVAQRAIYQDFTNQMLVDRGYKVPLFTPERAGRILAITAQNLDLCLYEYFQTDRAGHSQDMEHALLVLEELERFLMALLENIDRESMIVLLTSDHGNLEDLSTGGHTESPAMTIGWGRGVSKILREIESLEDVAPALLRALA